MPHPPLARALVVLSAVLVVLLERVDAWYGVVTLYNDVGWDGPDFPWGITQGNRCYNLSCFYKRASSIEWDDDVKATGGRVDSSGRTYLAFYSEPNCKGDVRWWALSDDQPSDLTVNKFNDKIASFMLWVDSKDVTNGYETPCPWGTT